MTALPPPLQIAQHPARYIARHGTGQSIVLDTLNLHREVAQLDWAGNGARIAKRKAERIAAKLNAEHEAWRESEGDT